MSKNQIEISIFSKNGNFKKKLSCLTVPKIAEIIPDEQFPRESIRIPANLRLADPYFHVPRPVDILIGAGATLSMLAVGQIDLSHGDGDLILQKTMLGWVVVGNANGNAGNHAASCNLTELAKQIEKFWVMEDADAKSSKTREEILCENHYVSSTTRNANGRYVVRLPFRSRDLNLGNSRSQALRRFYALLKKFKSNPQLDAEYKKIMREYIDLGHMSLVVNEQNDGYYMPHHAIEKESSVTTKLRGFFYASAKTDKGFSLNDALMIGPTIQKTLYAHLLRFQISVYVLTADIKKMYRQIYVHSDDKKYQRIFWLHEGAIRAF